MGNTAKGTGRLVRGRTGKSKWMEFEERVDDFTLKRVEEEKEPRHRASQELDILHKTGGSKKKDATTGRKHGKVGRPSTGYQYQPTGGGGDWQGDIAEGQNTRENRREEDKKKRDK